MKVKKHVFVAVIAAMVTLSLSGCTPEKAEALLTVIKSFESKSLEAIGAYEQLFKDYRKLERETNDQVFEQNVAAIERGDAQAVTVDSMISALSLREEKKGDRTIERNFYDIKVVYISLRTAYESLPEGSVLGTEYVSCGRDIVAKATSQLVNFSMDIEKQPLYPLSLHQKVTKYKRLVKDKKEKEARLLLNEISANIKQYDTQHENALKLTLAAVEDGLKVHQLLGKYGEVSISDILDVVQFGLDFIGTLKGVDVTYVTTKLQSIQTDLGDKDYWMRIKSMPIAEIGNCNNKSVTNKE